MPRGSLSFLARPGGLPVPVGCLDQNEDHLPWPPELPALPWPPERSLHRHGLLSSLHRHGLQSSQLRHGLLCLFCSRGPRPVFLSVSVLRGLQSAHPPSPVELLRRGTRLPGGGSYVRVLLCVSCVPASCVHIWFVSCPC